MNHISLLQAIILGIVQGATEFLPVSSSAHLVILQHLFKLDIEAGPMVAFDVCLHVGTLLAVLFALRKEVVVILKGLFSKFPPSPPPSPARGEGVRTVPSPLMGEGEGEGGISPLSGGFSTDQAWRAVWLVLLGTIPAVILGFAFKDFFERLFMDTLPVGVALIVTGIILFLTRFVKRNDIILPQMKWWHSLAVGTAQALAIIPGISRSGSTISMGLFTKLDRQLAAKFSFLLSIPAIGGAAILEWKNFRFISHENTLPIALGTMASFIVGYLCVRLMLAIMRGARFSWFAIYCWAVGLATIIASL